MFAPSIDEGLFLSVNRHVNFQFGLLVKAFAAAQAQISGLIHQMTLFQIILGRLFGQGDVFGREMSYQLDLIIKTFIAKAAYESGSG